MNIYRILNNRSSFVLTFKNDTEAFEYVAGMSDDSSMAVIEKLMFGVWHSWDIRNEKWVKL